MIAQVENAFESPQSAADAYISLGWRLFPCHSKNGKGCTCGKAKCTSPAKHPRTENGVLDATLDRATIETWGRRTVNWGVAAGAGSGFWVLDVDPRHGGDRTLAELIQENGELPQTVEALTGGGGRHLIFRHPGFDLPNRTGGKSGMPEGLDVRGDGGYIIVAPATHIEGAQYRWRDGHSPLEIVAAEAPAWLLKIAVTKKDALPANNGTRPEASDLDLLMRAATSYIAKAAGVSEGSRAATAFGIAGHLFAFVVDDSGARLGESQALNLLRTWNDRNSPPLTDDELAHACKSAFEGKGTPRPDKVIERRRKASPNGRAKSSSHAESLKTDGPRIVRDDMPSLRTPDGRTELANARRFVAMHGERIRWCDAWGKWLVWDARRWAMDDTCAVESMAKDVFHLVWGQAAELRDDADAIRFAKATGSARGIGNFLALARSEPGIAIRADKLDADPYSLNVANGTINLRTGELRPHNREDLITRLCPTPFEPTATCPRWLSFLAEIVRRDEEIIGYLRRGAGNSIIGEVSEHALYFCFGEGQNGKTTFLQAITDTLGDDYAMTAPTDFLMAKHGDQHPTALADLHGKRFIASIEAGEGRRLAEALVKTMTGGDKIRARRMREDFWEFRPSHSIWLAANHKPIIRGRDVGIWRRIKLIPFTVNIPLERQDPELPKILRAEAPGILAWAVRGCKEWQANGMQAPEAIKKATADYRDEMDVLGEFIAECCIVGNAIETPSSELFGAYGRWCQRAGERQMSRTAFGNGLGERGLEKVKHGTVRWRGIELQTGA